MQGMSPSVIDMVTSLRAKMCIPSENVAAMTLERSLLLSGNAVKLRCSAFWLPTSNNNNNF